MAKLRLYNTLTRAVEDFVPARDGMVRLYTCGPTVYNYQHVGNYRTYIFEDVLKRTLRALGYPVRHVMNITDVGHLTDDGDEGEDKLEVGAAREGKTAGEIARFYEEGFLKDLDKLNISFGAESAPKRMDEAEPADILCRATEHIPEQTAMVDRLLEKEFAYEISDGIYFDTSKFPDYGALMGTSRLSGNKEGARVQANAEKRNASDFAVWKFSPKGETRHMEWEYRGRKGFPGWHIECSAMGQTYLGDSFDIHCGGADHISIHHTNEIAQAEAATGRKPFVRFWLHGEFLVINKSKMAKSAGGFLRIEDLEEEGFSPLDYRYFCFGAHYRRQLDFSWESLEAAKRARCRLREKTEDLKNRSVPFKVTSDVLERSLAGASEKFKLCLAKDLNMPEALASVYDAIEELSSPNPDYALRFLDEAENVLALGLFGKEADEALPEELQVLFNEYVEARKMKNFTLSDELRKKLKGAGVCVFDTKDGSRWKRA